MKARPSWFVALDLDGTTLHEDGSISDAVAEQVRRVDAAGHQVVLTTGRSAATVPVLDALGIAPRFLVCSNGAVTLRRDPAAPGGYRRHRVETFDPADVLRTVRAHLRTAASRSRTNTVATGTPSRSPRRRSGCTASSSDSRRCSTGRPPASS